VAQSERVSYTHPWDVRIRTPFRVTLWRKSVRNLILTLITFSLTCSGAAVPGFEARGGQYVSHGRGYSLSVSARAAVLSLSGHSVTISVPGASAHSSIEALRRMPGRASYLLGNRFPTSYDLYGGVEWRGVYPGIDVVFHANQEHMEYDFQIAAGRDPSRIKVGFDGIDHLSIARNGDLILRAGVVQIRQPKPSAYQLVAGMVRPVDVAYRIDRSNRVRFETGPYDRARALVIDPQIVFDNTFGGSGTSVATGLARDPQGNLYVTGYTNSTDFATVNPFQKQLGAVALLSTADGGKTFSAPTLAGATSVTAIAASPSAPLTIYAATPIGVFKSADGGTTWVSTNSTGLAGNTFVLAVDAVSSTTLYAGTDQGLFISTNGGANWRAAIVPNGNTLVALAADPSQAGTVYATFLAPAGVFRSTDSGQTWSQLTIAPFQLFTAVDAFAFGPGGTIIAASSQGLLISPDGGNTWNAGAYFNVDNNQALAISPANANLVYAINPSGLQRSTDGGQTFTVVISALMYGRVAVDPRNPSTVYAVGPNQLYKSTDTGQTWTKLSPPYSITAQSIFVSAADSRLLIGTSTQSNVFITKWSADGSQVLYSTYLGGNGGDQASAIAVDASGSAYVTGVTNSPNFPTTSGAFQTKLTNAQDVFVAKLSPDGSKLTYSTLLGSASATSAAIAVDSTGSAVLTGFTGGQFPVSANSPPVPTGATCHPPLVIGAPVTGEAFVTRIAANGSALNSSILFSGSCATYGAGIALDSAGNAWIAGTTLSPDLPVTPDALQASFSSTSYSGYLASFDSSGSLKYATYAGGQAYTSLAAIALDQAGNIYVTGETGGLSQPASPGAFQPQDSATCPAFFMGPSEFVAQGNAIVLKLDAKTHAVAGLTYLGAPGCLTGTSIAVDSAGEPWIAGSSQQISVSLQTASPLQIGIGSGFVSKFSADFTQLLFSTYFDNVAGLTLDPSGPAYVAGTQSSMPGTATLPVYIAKLDPTPAAVELDSIENLAPSAVPNDLAAEFPSGSPTIAAGEILRILGKNLGPVTAASGLIQSGVLASGVGGVQVTFGGVAAPILFAGAREIDVIAPFELAGASRTTVQVQYNGQKSNPVAIAVSQSQPQILGVFNLDFTPNSPSNPAAAGSTVVLYVSGLGPSNPSIQDGQINVAPLAAPAQPLEISNLFGSGQTPIIFAGAALGLAAGIFQINFTAPQQTATMELFASNGNQTGGITLFSVYVQ
jgi:uncharacterized protein (TIGR03437 family)